MRRLVLILVVVACFLYIYVSRAYWFLRPVTRPLNLERIQYKDEPSLILTEGLEFLRVRKDDAAWANFTRILAANPQETDALWGKAEVLRRKRGYEEAESLLDQVLSRDPNYVPAMVSLAYIKVKQDRLDEAQNLIANALQCYLKKDNEALAYMMLGYINSKKAQKGNILGKLHYGTQIKCYFLKAKELAPDLPEVRLALGTFYLEAPALVGGNIRLAGEELTKAVELAPDFATANARLAQYYRNRSDFVNYNIYIEKAEMLDPDNELLKELKQGRGI
jgi:Tfp pilus assembly protein PilF